MWKTKMEMINVSGVCRTTCMSAFCYEVSNIYNIHCILDIEPDIHRKFSAVAHDKPAENSKWLWNIYMYVKANSFHSYLMNQVNNVEQNMCRKVFRPNNNLLLDPIQNSNAWENQKIYNEKKQKSIFYPRMPIHGQFLKYVL